MNVKKNRGVHTILSPVTGGENIETKENIDLKVLKDRWMNEFSIDISTELDGIENLTLYHCQDSKLDFFYPISATGSSFLYENLSKFDWYYMEDKWEFEKAEKDIKDLTKIAEVGCAKGDFLQRLKQKNFDVVGFEFNKKAAADARDKGITVYTEDIECHEELKESFDAVCSFQVLEHVTDPRKFLLDLLKLIRPGGLLILSTPNAHVSETSFAGSLLDMPPHHVTRWYPETFRKLENYLPVKLARMVEEPLAPYHVDWYLGGLLQRIPSRFHIRGVYKRYFENIYRKVLLLGARRFIKGHTLYACLKKI